MSLFSGYARQAAALPPAQQRAAAPARPRRRSLFGGGDAPDEWGLIQTLIGGTDARDAAQARALSQREAAAARQVEDRLRAQLSPADGPMGSGTGAAPTTEQQMSAINDARLLNPGVADQFAPAVMGRQRQEQARSLFPDDPRAQALWAGGNEEFANSQAKQYAPMTAAEGTAIYTPATGGTFTNERRSVVGDRVVGMGTNTQGPRELLTVNPSYADVTARQNADSTRITAERPQIATMGAGVEAIGVSPYGDVQQLGRNSAPTAPNPVQTELRSSYDTNQREVIPTLNQMRASLASGDVITGLGADVQLQIARAAAAAGNQDAQRRVAATEAYRNMSGRLRVGMAKTLGANPSNADIALLEQITAGNIGQNSESLLATIDQGLAFANRRTTDLEAQMGGQGGQQAPQGGSAGGQVYENPQTGQRIRWNGSAWVPAQ